MGGFIQPPGKHSVHVVITGLGTKRNATRVKAAVRRLAQKYHGKVSLKRKPKQ